MERKVDYKKENTVPCKIQKENTNTRNIPNIKKFKGKKRKGKFKFLKLKKPKREVIESTFNIRTNKFNDYYK